MVAKGDGERKTMRWVTYEPTENCAMDGRKRSISQTLVSHHSQLTASLVKLNFQSPTPANLPFFCILRLVNPSPSLLLGLAATTKTFSAKSDPFNGLISPCVGSGNATSPCSSSKPGEAMGDDGVEGAPICLSIHVG